VQLLPGDHEAQETRNDFVTISPIEIVSTKQAMSRRLEALRLDQRLKV